MKKKRKKTSNDFCLKAEIDTVQTKFQSWVAISKQLTMDRPVPLLSTTIPTVPGASMLSEQIEAVKKINIQYRSVAVQARVLGVSRSVSKLILTEKDASNPLVQASDGCPWVGFRFGWVDDNAEDLDHMAEHMAGWPTVLQLGTPTFFEALGFDLGTIR